MTGITQTIESDLHLLYWVARQLKTVCEPGLLIVSIVGEGESITRELNLEYEVAHPQRFQRNFSAWSNVHIPEVYPEFLHAIPDRHGEAEG